MSAQEPVIAVLNETLESESVDSSAVPPSEDLVVKDTPNIMDSSPAEPVTELPAESAQTTASDDTPAIPLKHYTNIPDATPANLNSSVNGAEVTSFVNEPDHTLVPVEIPKLDDASEVAEDKAPIKDALNGDVEGDTSGGFEGADLDLADQTLVEDLSRDADTSVIQEVADVPVKVLDADAKKIVVEEDEDDRVPEPVAVPGKDEEEAMAPIPDVIKPATVPVEEETSAPAETVPMVESKLELVDTEHPVLEVDAIDSKNAEPMVDLTKDEPVPSEEPVIEEEAGVVSIPAPTSDALVAEPVESNPTELAGDIPSVTEDALPGESEPTPAELVIADLGTAKEVEPHAAELDVAPEPIETVTVTKEDPEHVPEELAKVEDPVAEVEAVPIFEPKEVAPPATESASEPVIEDLDEAKKVEEFAAKIEVAPVVSGSNAEEVPAEDPVVEATVVPQVPNEDAPLPVANRDGHPDEELAGPVEKETLQVVVPEKSTPSIPETSAPGEVEPVIEKPEEAGPPVQDDEVSLKVEDPPSTTETVEPGPAEQVDVEPESVEEVQVTEHEKTGETLLIDESPAQEPVTEPSNRVNEVPVEAEPVVATPLTFAVPEHVMEPVVTEEAPAISSVEDFTPDVVTEETPAVGELEVPTPEFQEKIEKPAPVFAAPVEGSEPSPEVTEQEIPISAVSEPTVEPAAEEGSASGPLESDVPAPEPALGEVPSVESESVGEPQPSVSEKKPSADEVEPEEDPPTISDPVKAAQDIPASDIPQEETKQVQSSWTPSYSISSQGGGLDTVPPADEEVESAPAPKPLVEESPTESAPASEIVTTAEEPAVVEPEVTADNVQEPPSWTPSYSTTVQDSSSRFEPRATPESEVESVSAGPENAPTAIQRAEPEPAITEPVEESTPQVVSPAEELTTVEPEATPEDVSKSSSWAPSYSTIVQGSSPHFESETVLKDDSEAVSSEPPASDDVSATIQDTELTPTPAEPVAAEEDPKPAGTEDVKSADEVPIDRPSEQPSDAFDTSLNETPSVVGEAEASSEGEIVSAAATIGTPWTQSYSATSQPVSPKVEMKELEPEPHPVESIQETPVALPVFDLTDVPKTVVTHAAEDEDERVAESAPEEEPKVAWTQSYSVTSQPGSPRVSPKQVPEEIPEVEEVKPSWTQSYSVTSQPGSPRDPPKDLPEPILELAAVADEPTAVVTPPVGEAVHAPVEAEASERPKSPWTPSYPATTLEGQAEQDPPEDAVPESEVAPIPKTFVGEAPDPQPEVDAPVAGTPTSEPLTAKDNEPERPKSPWTPSYSVTTLPGSAPAEESEPCTITNKPPVGTEMPPVESVEAVKAAEERPKESGAISDVFEVHEAITQLAVHDEPQVDVKTPEPAPPQLELPEPGVTSEAEEEPSWTPSYSVTHLPGASPKEETKEESLASPNILTTDGPTIKGVGSTSQDPHTQELTTNGTTTETKDDGPHYFPRVPESLDEAPEKPKLDLLTSVDPSSVSKISPRTRYESSTSSRLFPGAWLSSPRSPPDDTRTSMEEATGEFIHPKSSVAPNEPAVAEASEDVPASPITPATPTTKKDKKWRMCEIM